MAVPPVPAHRPDPPDSPSAEAGARVHLVPSRWLVLFFVALPDVATVLALRPAQFLDGLNAVRALCGFGTLVRCDDVLDELLPWAGNV